MNDHISASQIDGKYHLGHRICKQKGMTGTPKHSYFSIAINNSFRCAGWTAKVLAITMKLGPLERCSSKCRHQTSSKQSGQLCCQVDWIDHDYGRANIRLLAVIKVGASFNAKLRQLSCREMELFSLVLL